MGTRLQKNVCTGVSGRKSKKEGKKEEVHPNKRSSILYDNYRSSVVCRHAGALKCNEVTDFLFKFESGIF